MANRARDYGGSERLEPRARPATASTRTKLKKFLLRYYPPGIILEYEHMGELMQRSVDLLDLTPESDADALLEQIVRQESMIKPAAPGTSTRADPQASEQAGARVAERLRAHEGAQGAHPSPDELRLQQERRQVHHGKLRQDVQGVVDQHWRRVAHA